MIRKPTIALIAALATPCVAELLVDEPFDYAQGNLTGESGGSGWSGAWTQDGESCAVVPALLGYSDSAFNVLSVSGLSLDTSGPDTTRSFRSVSNGPLNDVWISFLFRLPASNSLFEGVNFYRGSTSVFAVSNSSVTAGSTITLNNFVEGGSPDTGLGEFGQTHFIVLHLIEGGGPGGDDLLELYIDPLLTGPASAPVATTSAPDLGFDRIRIAGQSGAPLGVDELRIGDTFSDIAPFVSEDPDGDGLSNSQESELGLNPVVSDAELISAIKEHPEYFGLFSRAGILNLVDNGVVVEGREGSSELIFEIQQSTNLLMWQNFETVHRGVELVPGKTFLRLIISDPSP